MRAKFRASLTIAGLILVAGAVFLLWPGASPESARDAGHGPRPPAHSPLTGAAASASAPGTTVAIDPEKLCQDFHATVCSQKRTTTYDPTGLVRRDIEGEILVLRMFEEIALENPGWNRDRIYETLVSDVYSERRRQRLIGAYHWVESTLIRIIEGQPKEVFSASEKRRLRDRIRRTKFQLPPPASVYADQPDLFTKNGVFYERLTDGTLRLRVGGAYLLTADSWFNLVFTLAHELGHVIDPCEIRASGHAFPAYDRLGACFLREGLVAIRRTRFECGDNDQLSEAFADWIAAQVVAEALKSFATEFDRAQLAQAVVNSVRDLCEQGESLREMDLTYHPAPKIRVERIFGDHPMIRGLLGCGPPPGRQPASAYCDLGR